MRSHPILSYHSLIDFLDRAKGVTSSRLPLRMGFQWNNTHQDFSFLSFFLVHCFGAERWLQKVLCYQRLCWRYSNTTNQDLLWCFSPPIFCFLFTFYQLLIDTMIMNKFFATGETSWPLSNFIQPRSMSVTNFHLALHIHVVLKATRLLMFVQRLIVVKYTVIHAHILFPSTIPKRR